MKIHSLKITNFKSCYGTEEIIFDDLTGLVKLSGPIGAGKTLLCEALQWGLLGVVKGQTNISMVSWNTQSCEVEVTLTSKNKMIYIKRNIIEPLVVEVDGKPLIASNKRNAQTILEEDLFDIPKLAIIKMCLISFNGFSTLADMNPGQTKEFIDEIFGFRLFTEYNSVVQENKKNIQNNIVKLIAMEEDNMNNVKKLEEKRHQQQLQLGNNFDLNKLKQDRDNLVAKGIEKKNEKTKYNNEYTEKKNNLDTEKLEYYRKKNEYATLGKQEKNFIEKFKNGICPTCGSNVDSNLLNDHKSKMLEYADLYKKEEKSENEIFEKIKQLNDEYSNIFSDIDESINLIKQQINKIDSDIAIYNNNVKLINENYDDLINQYNEKINEIKNELSKADNDIKEWSELEELFTKTLRYNLLNTLIPHINKSINYFINRLEQPYRVEFDQEFKCHIYTDMTDKEISYSNLSTGQKKTIDISIVFGILQNMIANVDMNVIILDELMSNMDAETRNVLLSVLKDSLAEDKTIFIVNHAEMNDDYFDHKIRVSLKNKRIKAYTKKKEAPKDVIVRASTYEKVF